MTFQVTPGRPLGEGQLAVGFFSIRIIGPDGQKQRARLWPHPQRLRRWGGKEGKEAWCVGRVLGGGWSEKPEPQS